MPSKKKRSPQKPMVSSAAKKTAVSEKQALGGAKEKYAPGKEFMIFKDSCGRRCSSTTPGKQADSRVARFHREIGFLRNDSAEEKAHPEIKDARDEHRLTGVTDKSSQQQIIIRQSYLERWAMEKMPNHEFTTYLKSLDDEGVDGRRIPVAYQVN